MKEKTVDIIIPVYQPDSRFFAAMDLLDRQTKRAKHIALLHTLEEGELDTLQSQFTNRPEVSVWPVQKKDFDHGGTRAYGASLSNADYLLFMTQDALPADDYLIERLLEGFQDENTAVVYARQLAGDRDGAIETFTREFNYPGEDMKKTRADLERLGIKTYFCSNVCAAYRRDIYEKLGGFVKRTIFNEDMIMAARCIEAGYSIYYASRARVVHSHSYTCRQQFKRNFDLAVSQMQYRDIFDEVKSESEGIRLVKETAKYLIRKKKPGLLPKLFLQSAFKYMGYRAGLRYKSLPDSLLKKWSMNPAYWEVKRKRWV